MWRHTRDGPIGRDARQLSTSPAMAFVAGYFAFQAVGGVDC